MKVLDAIKKLNGLKNEDGELLIETIDLKELKGAKEKDLAEAFMTAIESLSEEDSDKYIPEELAELYNKLAGTEAEPEEEKEVAKPAAKAAKKPEAKPIDKKKETKAKPEAVKKKADSKKPAAKAEAKKEGVIASILTIIKDHQPISMEGILKALIKIFPERDATAMGKTIRAQIGGRGETRLGKEKGVRIKKTDSGEFIIAKK